MNRQSPLGIVVIMFITFTMLLYANLGLANSNLHTPFNRVLEGNVINGQVDYSAIKLHPEFKPYIDSLKAKPTFNNQNEELTYWINAYNALVIKGILEGGSPSTFFGRNSFFKGDQYQLADMFINLNDLERKVIIPIGEPRIHFAINCASSSCPKLRPQVFTADELDTQLEHAANEFINDTSRNKFDSERKIARISKIFDWFEEDFVKHSGSVQKYLSQYVNNSEIAEHLRNEEYKIKYLKYDWSLNGTKP
ncbi:MAG: DUF547 domain-containing protein [Pseudomonadota bacterium]